MRLIFFLFPVFFFISPIYGKTTYRIDCKNCIPKIKNKITQIVCSRVQHESGAKGYLGYSETDRGLSKNDAGYGEILKNKKMYVDVVSAPSFATGMAIARGVCLRARGVFSGNCEVTCDSSSDRMEYGRDPGLVGCVRETIVGRSITAEDQRNIDNLSCEVRRERMSPPPEPVIGPPSDGSGGKE